MKKNKEVTKKEITEEVVELTQREKILLARKKNLQRKKRSKLPSNLR
tara:strand:+ start:211 stop:351 length:141 start_codon:yes stop_codon:yes gene_type:complete